MAINKQTEAQRAAYEALRANINTQRERMAERYQRRLNRLLRLAEPEPEPTPQYTTSEALRAAYTAQRATLAELKQRLETYQGNELE